jgi:hypothetical protein
VTLPVSTQVAWKHPNVERIDIDEAGQLVGLS